VPLLFLHLKSQTRIHSTQIDLGVNVKAGRLIYLKGRFSLFIDKMVGVGHQVIVNSQIVIIIVILRVSSSTSSNSSIILLSNGLEAFSCRPAGGGIRSGSFLVHWRMMMIRIIV
jgi:hypothetical protein